MGTRSTVGEDGRPRGAWKVRARCYYPRAPARGPGRSSASPPRHRVSLVVRAVQISEVPNHVWRLILGWDFRIRLCMSVSF